MIAEKNRDPRAITEDEWALLDLGRELKTRTGEGTLTIKYRNGREELFEPTPKIKPPTMARPRP